MKRCRGAAAVLLSLLCACALHAQKADIAFRFNTLRNDGKNMIRWSSDGKTVKDRFDAETGASVSKSTAAFDVIRWDQTGKKHAVPEGLRALMMYPVSSWNAALRDDFSVAASGKKVVVTFIHRGTAYRITSGADGSIDVPASFEILRDAASYDGRKFTLRKEYAAAGADPGIMKSFDWTKAPLVPDAPDADAGFTYSGTLSASFRNGVLTVKGRLRKAAAAKPAAAPDGTPADGAKAGPDGGPGNEDDAVPPAAKDEGQLN